MKVKSYLKDRYENGNLKGKLQTAGVVAGVSAALGLGIFIGEKNHAIDGITVTKELEKTFSYDDLEECILLSIDNGENIVNYITNKEIWKHSADKIVYIYTDIKTKETVLEINMSEEINKLVTGEKESLSFKENGKFTDYLTSYDLIKDSYTIEDLDDVLDRAIEDNNTKEKQLIK